MKIKNNIAVSDNGFVFNPASGESFSVNPVGLEMLNLLRKGLSNEKVIEEIETKYQVDSNTLERDLNDFIEMVKQYHLNMTDDE